MNVVAAVGIALCLWVSGGYSTLAFIYRDDRASNLRWAIGLALLALVAGVRLAVSS